MGLCQTWLETQKTGFLASRLIYSSGLQERASSTSGNLNGLQNRNQYQETRVRQSQAELDQQFGMIRQSGQVCQPEIFFKKAEKQQQLNGLHMVFFKSAQGKVTH